MVLALQWSLLPRDFESFISEALSSSELFLYVFVFSPIFSPLVWFCFLLYVLGEFLIFTFQSTSDILGSSAHFQVRAHFNSLVVSLVTS